MDTMRLLTIQQPSALEQMLESYAVTHLPDGIRRILDRSEMSASLQGIAIRAKRHEQTWAAWTDDHRIWLFTAEMSLAASRERGLPVLHIHCYSEHGALLEAGRWVRDRDGRWRSCLD